MTSKRAAREELDRLTREQAALRRELAAVAIANARAHAELRRVQAELTASRARIAAAADETRRRIERDLHDGAQQWLVTLALRLRVVQDSVPPDLAELRTELGQVTAALTSALDELRQYARGIHPAILAERGLAAALTALARRSPVPVQLDVRTAARLPGPVEAAAYFVVAEALANAARHANATVVRVAVGLADGVARVSVSDDGVGGADPARGSGLTGLKDRVEAAGGALTVRSRPGEGTRLIAELPAGSDIAAGTVPTRSESLLSHLPLEPARPERAATG
jgi:signal transduction histidine kinase